MKNEGRCDICNGLCYRLGRAWFCPSESCSPGGVLYRDEASRQADLVNSSHERSASRGASPRHRRGNGGETGLWG